MMNGGVAPTGNVFPIPILAEDRAGAPVRVGFGHLEVAAGDVVHDALVKGRLKRIFDHRWAVLEAIFPPARTDRGIPLF